MLTYLTWLACRLSSLQSGAAPLSLTSWSPPPGAECIPGTVPGTILNDLINNGTFLRPDNSTMKIVDPYIDDWLANASIPDISSIGSDFYTFVYRTILDTTTLCSLSSTGSTIILSAPQISYRASLFVDGTSIQTIDGASEAIGMFKRHDFSLGSSSAFCNSTLRAISVLIKPPDHFGIPSAFCDLYPPNFNNTTPCGQGGNHSLAQEGVISQDGEGWDFQAASPDRNTGIIDGLELFVANSSVLLRDGATDLYNLSLSNYGGIGALLERGNITFRVSARNVGTYIVSGTVTFMIDTSDSHSTQFLSTQVRVNLQEQSDWVEIISDPVSLPPGIALWWPHTIGHPSLRSANASFVADSISTTTQPATTITWRAGLRTLSCDVDINLGGRAITVNGKRFYVEGGNFVGTDLLSRPYYRSDERYSDEVKLHAAMGMNTIRLWAGHAGHPDSLFNAADEAGILLWNEFFQSGDNNGRWAGNSSWPLDHSLYNAAVTDTVRRLRGHASLLVHVGGNELFPFNASPPSDILSSMISTIEALDPSTTFVQSSMGSNEFANFSGFDPELAWAPSDGPYGILDERSFFAWPAPGKAETFNIPWTFQPELGASAHPSRTSLERFLSSKYANAIPGPRGLNTDSMWTWHSFESFGDNFDGDAIYALAPNGNKTSPETWGLEGYSAAAAVVQVLQLQALFEAYADRMFMPRSGVLYWKSAGSWPALRGALYDYYLAPCGGYFGAMHALETIHVQLSRRPSDTGGASIAVVNRGGLDLAGGSFIASVSAIDLITGEIVGYQVTSPLSYLPSQSVIHIPDSALIWPPLAPTSVALLWRVQLFTFNQTIISTSEYIMSTLDNDPKTSPQNFTALAVARVSKTPLIISALCTSSPSGGVVAQVNLSIATGVALFLRCDLHDEATRFVSETGSVDDRVLPTYPNSGFFALLSDEEKQLSLSAPRALWPSTTLAVECEGWNVDTTRVSCV